MLASKILIIDDDSSVLTTARLLLKHHFESVKTCHHPTEALQIMDQFYPDVVLLDMNFQRGENDGAAGMIALQAILKKNFHTKVILLTAYGDIDLAVEAIKAGGVGFVVKPWTNEKLLTEIRNALKLQIAEKREDKFKSNSNESVAYEKIISEELIGNSPAFIEILDVAKKVASTDANVLILGENGTGKDVVARYIHSLSTRKNQVFYRVDVGSLHEQILESELFGHVKGAFTDAKEDKPGKFELAQGGTLFLDEIGNLPITAQSKILTALQQKTITRVGGNTLIPIDFRLITATNQSIYDMAKSGNFRQDLIFRINTIELSLPPLRQRNEDIPSLSAHFINHFCKKYRKATLTLSDRVLNQLQKHLWPGNIRELMHTIERAVIMAETDTIDYISLTPQESMSTTLENSNLNLQENELILIQRSLQKNKGNITRAAKELGIDRLALYRRMEKYGIK
jgi:DNA-binding NtrC family response regulator